jgi:hypothetical protein
MHKRKDSPTRRFKLLTRQAEDTFGRNLETLLNEQPKRSRYQRKKQLERLRKKVKRS